MIHSYIPCPECAAQLYLWGPTEFVRDASLYCKRDGCKVTNIPLKALMSEDGIALAEIHE